MPRRNILTARQRAALFDLPTDEASLLQHYTLADDDIEHVRERRRPENQLGFALQLCALRHPGRLLGSGEVIPGEALNFIGAQLGITGDALLTYAARRQTRQEHLVALREIYGYRMFTGKRARRMKTWLAEHTEAAGSGEDLVRGFVKECRRRQVILPGVSMIERLCADALVAAERRIETRIATRLDDGMRARLDGLLGESADGRTSWFVWLRFSSKFPAPDSLMPRMRILNAAEQAHYDSPPVFSSVERKRFFEFFQFGMDAVHGLRSPTSRIGFLLAHGYFRATRRFFPAERYHERDIAFVARVAGTSPDGFSSEGYRQRTRLHE